MLLFQLFDKLDNIIRKRTIFTLSDFVFWIAFCLLLVIHGIENTALTYSEISWFPLIYYFRNFLYLILLGKIFFLSSYASHELLLVGAALFLGIASFLCTDDFGLCELIIIIIAAKDIDSDSMIQVFFLIKALSVAITLLLYFLGIMPTLYYNDDIVGYYNTYGFCHRNVLGANMVVICLSWFYLRYENINKKDILSWSFIAIVTYFFALSRSTLIIMFLTIAFLYFFQEYSGGLMKIHNIDKYLSGILVFLFTASLIGTILFNADSSFWNAVDRFFTKRFRFSHQCLVDHGLSIFGKNLPFLSSMDAQNIGKRKLILDNTYMRAVLYYGLIPGGAFLYSYYAAFKKALSKNKEAVFLCLLIISIYGFSERYMLDINYNFPLLIACQCFFQKFNRLENSWHNSPFRLSYEYLMRKIK